MTPPAGSGDRSGKGLRLRAEEEIAWGKTAPAPKDQELPSIEETHRLLHELQGQQIKLGMQHEEMRRAQLDLEGSQARYFNLYDLAPVGYFTISEQGAILDVNLTAANMLGLTRSALYGQLLSRFILAADQDIYYQHRKELFESGKARSCELRWVRKDAPPFWVRMEATIIRSDEGAPVCLAVISDITDRRQSEEKMKILADLVDIAPAAVTVHDFAGRFLYVNRKTFDLHGYSPEEFRTLTLHDIDVPESRDLIAARMERILRTGEASFEVLHYRKDGSIFPLSVHAQLGKWGEEQVILSIAIDISERKHQEEELNKLEKLLSETQAITKVGGWEYDPAARRITWTDEVYRIYGVSREYDPNDIRRNTSPYHPDDAQMIETAFQRAVEAGEPYDLELRFIRMNGETIWVRTMGRPLIENGKVVRISGNFMDVTARKLIEDELKASRDHLDKLVTLRTVELEETNRRLTAEIEKHRATEAFRQESEGRYRSIFDNIGVGISIISSDMRILSLNPRMREWFPDINPEKKPRCYEAFNNPPRRKICPRCPTIHCFREERVAEALMETPSGDLIRYFRIVASPLHDEKGHVIAAIEMVTDITESIETHRRLQETEARYRTIFETTGTAMIILDEHMAITLANNEFIRQSGLTPEQVIGNKDWLSLVAPEDRPLLRMRHQQRREDPEKPPRSYEFRFLSTWGGLRNILVTVAMIPETQKSIASLMDITPLKQTEEALRRREADLAAESLQLADANTALRVLLQRREADQQQIENKIMSNIRELVYPQLDMLRTLNLNAVQTNCLEVLAANLEQVTAPFLQNLSTRFANFTSREIQIANLIRNGKNTKDIARLFNVSIRSVDFHRDNIRRKLDLSHKKTNLHTFLAKLGEK